VSKTFGCEAKASGKEKTTLDFGANVGNDNRKVVVSVCSSRITSAAYDTNARGDQRRELAREHLESLRRNPLAGCRRGLAGSFGNPLQAFGKATPYGEVARAPTRDPPPGARRRSRFPAR